MTQQLIASQLPTFVFVGSTNPVKISAVQLALSDFGSKIQVIGLNIDSGVSGQPKSDSETQLGADQRAQAVLTLGLSQNPQIQLDELVLGIGLEGGVFQPDLAVPQLWSTVWVSLATNFSTELFRANGARFRIPDQIAGEIIAGREMGDVVGDLTQNPNLKRQGGMIGLITAGFVDRTIEYTALTKLVIGLWYGRDWYQKIIDKS